jgi:hypothetical protein
MGKVSYQLRTRWQQSPIMETCFTASAVAGRRIGGFGGRIPREKEQTHDIHLSAIFLRLHREHPEVAKLWRSEASILRDRGSSREKLPDAILEIPGQLKIVEFGGAYSKAKLDRFHKYWAAREIPYEIW